MPKEGLAYCVDPMVKRIEDSIYPEFRGSSMVRPVVRTGEQREASRLAKKAPQEWFRQIWNGPREESTRTHPAPFPEKLAHRLVRMFSFAGDTVLDPFMGTGTTFLASACCGWNGVGVEIDPAYVSMAKVRIERELTTLFRTARSERIRDQLRSVLK